MDIGELTAAIVAAQVILSCLSLIGAVALMIVVAILMMRN